MVDLCYEISFKANSWIEKFYPDYNINKDVEMKGGENKYNALQQFKKERKKRHSTNWSHCSELSEQLLMAFFLVEIDPKNQIHDIWWVNFLTVYYFWSDAAKTTTKASVVSSARAKMTMIIIICVCVYTCICKQ